MSFEDKLRLFEFTETWVNLHVITPEVLEELWREYQKGEDPNLEHYRWGAFRRYLDRQSSLDEPLIRQLYNLSLNEPDLPLRASMLFELMARDEFPLDLLETLAQSEYRLISKPAKKKIEDREEADQI